MRPYVKGQTVMVDRIFNGGGGKTYGSTNRPSQYRDIDDGTDA
jgi:hypothetical protein